MVHNSEMNSIFSVKSVDIDSEGVGIELIREESSQIDWRIIRQMFLFGCRKKSVESRLPFVLKFFYQFQYQLLNEDNVFIRFEHSTQLETWKQ